MNHKTIRLVTLILASLFVVSLSFAIIFALKLRSLGIQKDNETKAALATQLKELNANFRIENEKTTTRYIADTVFNSFEFSYPKVWSTNVKQEVGSTEELTFLADPNIIVLGKDSPNVALKIIVYKDKYIDKLKEFEETNKSAENPLTETDVTVSAVKGKKFVGINSNSKKEISYILLPLGEKTLYIGTEDLNLYSKNFETILSTFKIPK